MHRTTATMFLSGLLAICQAPAMAQSPLDGFYIGTNIGYGVGNYTMRDATRLFPGSTEIGAEGVVGGGFAGYGSLFSSYYFGVEGDLSGTSFGSGDAGGAQAERPLAGSLAGRLGYALSPTSMLFAKLGVGVQKFEIQDELGGKFSDAVTGVKLGAGLEADLGKGFFARVGWDIDVASKNIGGVRMDHGVSQAGTVGLGIRW